MEIDVETTYVQKWNGSTCHADNSVTQNYIRIHDSASIGQVVSLNVREGMSKQITREMKSESKTVCEIQCSVNGGDDVETTRTTNDAKETVKKEEDVTDDNNSSNLMLRLLDEFTKIYKDKLERLENSGLKMEEQNYMEEKVRLLESWLGELGEQNAVLVGTVAELEREAGTRVTLLQGALGDMAPTTRDACGAFRDHQLQVREMVEGRIAAEDEVERLRDQLRRLQESCRHFSTENANLHTDIESLLDVLTRARATGVWRCDDVSFLCITSEQVFGPVLPQSGLSTPSLRSCLFHSSPPSSLPPYSDLLPHLGSGTASSLASAGQGYGGYMEGAGEAPWLCEEGCAEEGAAALRELRLLREARDRANSLLVLRDKRIADLQCQLADLQQKQQLQQEQQQEQQTSLRTNGTDNGKLALCLRPLTTERERTDSLHSSLTEGEPLPADMQVEQQLAANIDVLASRLSEAEADSEAAREQVRALRADVARLQGLLEEAGDARVANKAVIENLERRLAEHEAKGLKQQLSRKAGPTEHALQLPNDTQRRIDPPYPAARKGDLSTREVACMTASASPTLADTQFTWQSRLQVSRLENEVSEKGILIRELQSHLATARHECHLKDETLDKVECKLQALRAELVEREERREYLEQQLVTLQRQLALEHTHKQELAAQVTSKGDLLRKLERENWSLAGQLNAKTAGADSLQLTADHVAGELISRDREVMEQRLTIASLQEALVATKQTCDVLRARLDEDFEESRQEIDFLRRENSSLLNQLNKISNDISSVTQREHEMRRKLSALKYHQEKGLRSTNTTRRHEVWLPTSRTDHFCEEDEYNYEEDDDDEVYNYEDDDDEEVNHSIVRNGDEGIAATNIGSLAQTPHHQSANRGPCGDNTLTSGQRLSENLEASAIGGHPPCGSQSAASQLTTENTSQEPPYWNNTWNKTTNINEENITQVRRMPSDDSRGLQVQNAGVKGQHVRWQREDRGEEERCPPLGWIPVPRRGACDVIDGNGGQKLHRSAELWEAQRALAEAQQERSHAHEQVLSLLRECNTLEEQIRELMLENSRLSEESSSRAAQLEEGRRQVVTDQLAVRRAREENDHLKRAMEQANEESVRLRNEFQAKCVELERVQLTWRAIEVSPGSSSPKNARHALGRPDEETGAILPREGEVSIQIQAIGTPDSPKKFPPKDRLDEKPPLPPQQINDADGRSLRRKTSHGNLNLGGEPSREDCSAVRCPSPIRKEMVSVGTSTKDKGEWSSPDDTEQSLVTREEFSDPIRPHTGDGGHSIPTNDSSPATNEDVYTDNLSVNNKKPLDSSNIVSLSGENLCSSFKGSNTEKESSSPLDEDSSTSVATWSDILFEKQTIFSDSVTVGNGKSRGGETALSSEADQQMMPLELGDASRPTLKQAMEWRNKLAAIRRECERVLSEGLVLKESNTKLKEQVSSLERVVRSLRAQQQDTADRLKEVVLERDELASAVADVVGGLRSWATEVSGQLTASAVDQDGPSKHLMLLHTEKRVLAERNAALQRTNAELRQLLQSFNLAGGNHVAHGEASSFIHQHQNGVRTGSSSRYSLTSYDFLGNRDSGVQEDVINSGGSETSTLESRKEYDDSARGSTQSSNVSCGSLEEHILNLNQNIPFSDQHVFNLDQHVVNLDQHVVNLNQHVLNSQHHDFILDQLETSACEERSDKSDLNLKNINECGKSPATVEIDFSGESSSPGTKNSPPTLRRLKRNGWSNHITPLSEAALQNGRNNIDWRAPGDGGDQKAHTLGQGSAKNKKTFGEYRQDLERLIALANSLLKSTRRILRASRIDAAPRLRCSGSLQDLRDNLKAGSHVRSFSASRTKWPGDDPPTASQGDITGLKTSAGKEFVNKENLDKVIVPPSNKTESSALSDDLILSKAPSSSGLLATPTSSGGGTLPYYSEDLCDRCRNINMEKAVARLLNRLDVGSSLTSKLSSLGSISEGNNNIINLAKPMKNSKSLSMAKELEEIQAIIQTNASLVTSIKSLTQGPNQNLNLGRSFASKGEQVTRSEECDDSYRPDNGGQRSKSASVLTSNLSCNTLEKNSTSEGEREYNPDSDKLLTNLNARTNERESGALVLPNLEDDRCCKKDVTANQRQKSTDDQQFTNAVARDHDSDCGESGNVHQHHQQQQPRADDYLQQTLQPSDFKGQVFIDGQRRIQPHPRRRGKGSLTTLL